MAEPPSCPMALDMSLRDSSYSVASGPCVVAQLPSEDMGRLVDAQSRDHGFLRTKMKVLISHHLEEQSRAGGPLCGPEGGTRNLGRRWPWA